MRSIQAPDREAEPSLLRKILRWTLLATVGLVLGVVALLLLRPESLLFYPAPHVGATPGDEGWDYEPVELETEDGETITGWYLPGVGADPGAGPARVALYCHGNGGNIGGRLAVLAGLRELGLAVLIFDYRGYGHSSGRPTVAGTRLDVRAAWRHLVEVRGHDPEEIVIWGRSLGGAVAIDLAAELSEAQTPPAALVVESSFTSTVEIGKAVYPWLPVQWFAAKIDYPSRSLLAKVTAPVLLAHSPDDDLIPASHGAALREIAETGAAARVDFVELDGGHNDGHLTQPRHLDAVAAFLRGPG